MLLVVLWLFEIVFTAVIVVMCAYTPAANATHDGCDGSCGRSARSWFVTETSRVH